MTQNDLVAIDAWQWNWAPDERPVPPYPPRWFIDALMRWPQMGGILVNESLGVLSIATREGLMQASSGDWVIRGSRGEVYACKPDIFEATYAPAVS